jgi:glucose-1-phosphate thymidylyltransferase
VPLDARRCSPSCGDALPARGQCGRGPANAIGDRCKISHAEINDSIVMDDSTVDVERNLVRSMVGKGSQILSSKGLIPKGDRLVVGENTILNL